MGDLDLISINFVLEVERHEIKKLLSKQSTVVARDSLRYLKSVQQYAFTSHHEDMSPRFIIYPTNDLDVKEMLAYATKKGYHVAVRTGGHQYSGASSTKDGILLDLSETFQEFIADDDGLVTMGISFKLIDLNRLLAERNLFVPHGQCAHVHVGGHAHTGGYGNSCRGFGLFGDRFKAIKVITADGHNRWIERGTEDSDERDLFYAVLGGSPGNFAILTHIKLQALLSEAHPHARGLRLVLPYTRSVMTGLMQIKADMASESNLPPWRCGKVLPPDFDMCITVLSIDVPGWDLPSAARKLFKLLDFDPHGADIKPQDPPQRFNDKIGVDQDEFDNFCEKLDEAVKKSGHSCFEQPGYIVVWAQWANVDGKPPATQAVPPGPWFDTIMAAAGDGVMIVNDWQGGPAKGQGLSFLTGQWTWPIKREFTWPYNKRTWVTNSTTLNTSGWVNDMIDRMEAALEGYKKGARLAMQVFHFGGPAASFITNPEKHDTAYSWREDTTVMLVMDCFFIPTTWGIDFVNEWQAVNDTVFKGPKSSFAPNLDRRVLWGSYAGNEAEKSLDFAHRFYFEDEEKYKKLQRIKARVDPNNLLTPNAFAIRAVPGARVAAE